MEPQQAPGRLELVPCQHISCFPVRRLLWQEQESTNNHNILPLQGSLTRIIYSGERGRSCREGTFGKSETKSGEFKALDEEDGRETREEAERLQKVADICYVIILPCFHELFVFFERYS